MVESRSTPHLFPSTHGEIMLFVVDIGKTADRGEASLQCPLGVKYSLQCEVGFIQGKAFDIGARTREPIQGNLDL